MKTRKGFIAIVAVTVMAVLFLVLLVWGYPRYKIYSQALRGEANLREQEWSKKVAIEEAKAAKESAELYAEAEVARAKGVAEANEIIGNSLQGNEVYIKYLMAETLKDKDIKLIYVPTEAGLPILEANRN